MGLESATYISELDATNPVGATDPVAQGANHIRMIKAVLQANFPNLGEAAVTVTAAKINQVVGSDITGFANPTAVVGPTAVNGTAKTAMRSDAAPAIDLTANYTWTGNHGFTAQPIIAATTDSSLRLIARETTGGHYITWYNNANSARQAYLGFSNTTGALNLAIDRNNTNLDIVTTGTGVVRVNGERVAVENLGMNWTAQQYFFSTVGWTVKPINAGSQTQYVRFVQQNGSERTRLGYESATEEFRIRNYMGDIRLISDTGSVYINSTGGPGYYNVDSANREIGFRGLEAVEVGSSFTLTQAYNGRAVHYTSGSTAYTVTLGTAMAATSTVLITNSRAAGNITITPQSGTLSWLNGNGLTTGNRTLGPGGVCTVWKFQSGNWGITGNAGLS